MALSKEERASILETIERTNRHKNKIPLEVPEEFQNFLLLSEDRVEITRQIDGYNYHLYIFLAKSREANCPVHINMHGGGFIGPHRPNDWMYSAYLADKIKGIVVDVDYTTSDVAPFPTALNQCFDAAKYVQSTCSEWGGNPERVSMGGYSAGASLTAGVALKAVETGEVNLCLQVLGYPLLDSVIAPEFKLGAYPASIPMERVTAFAELYYDGDHDAMASAYASPLYAADSLLSKLPDTLICSAGSCNFRYENEEYAAKLASLGVKVRVKRFVNSRHGFIPHFVAEWEEASEMIARTIRNT